MATTSVSTRNLVGVQSIAFIRPITLTLRLTAARPNTPMNIYFDGVIVNQWCKTATGSFGDPLISDASGALTVYFFVPSNRFNTGNRSILITDAPSLDSISINGSTYGSATANFTSTGVRESFQTTTVVTTRNTVIVEQVVPRPRPFVNGGSASGGNRGRDPLAQSFFTFGVEGGCFLTSIDLYFFTKDSTIPVQVDIRPLINGYPASAAQVDPNAIVVLNPSQVNVSAKATIPTRFTFNRPVYLDEDAEYCFVIFSNSKNYNVFTSRMGEVSFENGKKIFEQPYNGSLFKSENNITWVAEQFEDVKFTLNVAQFDTSVNSVVKFKATSPYYAVPTNQFSTTNGKPVIRVKHTVQHGLEVNSKVYVATDTNAIYNGIPAASIDGERTVTRVINEYEYEFNAASNATSTGKITTGQQLNKIYLESNGSNYTTAPTVSITGGGGSGATARAIISGGEVQEIEVLTKGTGYTTAPTVSITGGGGSGAIATSTIDSAFSININKPVNFFVSNIPAQIVGDTVLTAKATTTQLNYLGGNLNTYQPAETVDMSINGRTYLGVNSVIASRANEVARMGNNPSMVIEYNFSTSNPNISPVINISDEPSLIAYNYKISNQFGETLDSENATASIDQVVVSSGGSGYITPPTVVFTGGGGSGATATAVLTGGSVTSVNVTSGGTGYTSIPDVDFVRLDGTGSDATANAILTPFNSELTASSGTAYSRYVTDKISLETPSKGVNLISEIYSEEESNVDWYIRTSLSGSGTPHSNGKWVKLLCDVDRNKSAKPGDRRDYTFYLYDQPEFDTYDLKCVLRTTNPAQVPEVYNYRTIIVA